MKEKISIAKLVFRRIAEIWRTIPVEEVGYPIENNYKGGFIMKKQESVIKSGFRHIAEIWGTIPVEEVGYPIENNNRSTVKKVTVNYKSDFQTARLIYIAFNQR